MPDELINTDILGQLLLIQNTLEIMPDAKGMAEYLSKPLLDVPGVASIQICYKGQIFYNSADYIPDYANCPATDGNCVDSCGLVDGDRFKKIPLRTLDDTYGYLLLNLDEPADFPPYEPFLRNICNVMSRVIENREVIEKLKTSNYELQLITDELKKKTVDLEYHQSILEAILDCVADGIVACDKDAMLLLFNRASRNFHGLPVEHIPADKWAEHYDLYLPDGITPMKKEDIPLFKALNGQDVTNIEMVIAPKNASRHVLLATGRQLVSKDKDNLGAVASMNDITELRKAEKELREKEHLIYEQSRQLAMNELLVNISHHWRQPINAVSVLAQEIRDAYRFNELTFEHLDKVVKTIMNELKTLSDTIDDFRSFYRIEKNNKRFKVADVVRKTLYVMSEYFNENDITVDFHVKDDVIIEGYPNEYSKVVSTILNNTRDAFEQRNVEKGHIKIELYKDPSTGKVVLKISDNGGGVKDDLINKIFDPYFTTKPKSRGTGIGLYMANVLVQRKFQGVLRAENIDGGLAITIEI
ncbi:MAG: PAS domain-containing sensor histidine kinase [Nitrospirae bacterium]|nr:PAS domain-containing sensor histidine kinase [Nitrospirota bacterium]